jgi:hypothetical protein
MAALKKKITIVWYKKVAAVLKADSGLARCLSKSAVSVGTPDQKFEDFQKEVVEVTDALYAAGKDVYSMSKKEIADIAIDMLVYGKKLPAVAKPEPVPGKAPMVRAAKPAARRPSKPEAAPVKPAAKPAAKPAVKPTAKPARAARSRPKPKPEPVAAKKPEPEPETEPEPAPVPEPEPAPTTAPEPDLASESASESESDLNPTQESAAEVTALAAGLLEGAQPDEDEAIDEDIDEESESERKPVRKPIVKYPPPSNGRGELPVYVRANVPFILGCAILSNLQAAATLLAPYVNKDNEAREVLEKLNQLMDSIHQKTVLPSVK